MTSRFVLLALVALPLLAGCGNESQEPKLVPVSGTVTLDGRPLSGAYVWLRPTGDTRGGGAVGRTNTDGKFEVKSPPRGLGAVAGEYKVQISKLIMPDGSDFPENSPVAPMDSPAKEHLPPRYSDLEQTELTATVPESGGELSFALVKP